MSSLQLLPINETTRSVSESFWGRAVVRVKLCGEANVKKKLTNCQLFHQCLNVYGTIQFPTQCSAQLLRQKRTSAPKEIARHMAHNKIAIVLKHVRTR